MKKNLKYIQNTILYETMKVYTTRDLADRMIHLLNKKSDMDLTVYETHSDGIVFRKKRDGVVTDTDIIEATNKAVKWLINQSINTDDDIVDEINGNYDFNFDEKDLTDSFFSDILQIRRSGRLIYIEIDL